MSKPLPRTLALFLVVLTAAAAAAAPAEPRNQPTLRVPEGFVVEQVAGPERVRFPMFAAFDDDGRLYVAESSGGDLYEELVNLTRKCRISVLEDRDGDGSFESAQVFADKLVFPMGLVWRGGKLYAADPPDLITLEDTDGDGKADKRTTLLSGFGHTDNGSLHGLTFGPDGWLYMTMGQPDGYRLKRPDGSTLRGTSGALIRCRPDGSDPQVLSRGFENLVELVFTPAGDRIGTDNWFSLPTAGVRDALVHLLDGGLYPHVPDAPDATPQLVSGPPLPPVSMFPAVALSGLTMQRSPNLGEALVGNLFSAQHNTRKVGRHVLVREGSTFRSEDHDFLTTDDPDFHPSDVLEDADGSLLVVDTGSWYVHHCPTGQIRQSPATGGIYRVRRAGAAKVDDPWGRSIDWAGSSREDLANRLADPRPAVQDRAARALVALGGAADDEPLWPMLRRSDPPGAAQRAAWVLAEVTEPKAAESLRAALRFPDPAVTPAVARALGALGDRRAARDLRRLLLASKHAPLRLAAAEALASCGDADSLPALWQALSGKPDRFLEHAIIHAVHRICGDDASALHNALVTAPDPAGRRAALLLLDQPPRPRGALRPDDVVRVLEDRDPAVRETAAWVIARHPEWTEEVRTVLSRWLASGDNGADHARRLEALILAFESDGPVQSLVLREFGPGRLLAPAARRMILLKTIAGTRLPETPGAWVKAIDLSLDGSVDPAVRAQAARTAAELQPAALDERLAALAENPAEPDGLRLDALRAVVARRPRLGPRAVDLLLAQLAPDAAPPRRLAAAAILSRSRLDGPQTVRVLAAAKDDKLLSPADLLAAFDPMPDDEAAEALRGYVSRAVERGWRPTDEQWERMSNLLPQAKRAGLSPIRQRARADVERQRQVLSEFEPLLTGGDAGRGRAVFFSAGVACGSCHRVGVEGGAVGPDLTKVGAVRAGRDILESILFPSSTFAQGYDSYVVQAKQGQTYSGIVPKATGDVVVIRDAAGNETRLHKDQVRRMQRQPVSVMPEGLGQAMTREQFRDLLAFLQGLK